MGEEQWSQFQAILAGLPMHAVPSPLSFRNCVASEGLLVQCSGQRSKPPQMDPRSSKERIRDELRALSEEYPEHKETLSRLEVVGANLDLVCLADHVASRLFTAARGTDRNINPLTFPRDWGNNLMIVFGNGPLSRAMPAVDDYRACRGMYPTYTSYGSGHSLGGAVMVQLAKSVEESPELSFSRVDVFNTAISPLSRTFVRLTNTALHVHRTPGDWASIGLSWMTVEDLHEHPVKPHIPERHSLKHFLPAKASERDVLLSTDVGEGGDGADARRSDLELQRQASDTGILAMLATFTCVGVRSKAAPLALPRSASLPARRSPSAGERRVAFTSEGGEDSDEDSPSFPSSPPSPSPRGSPLAEAPGDAAEEDGRQGSEEEDAAASPNRRRPSSLFSPAPSFSLEGPLLPPPLALPEEGGRRQAEEEAEAAPKRPLPSPFSAPSPASPTVAEEEEEAAQVSSSSVRGGGWRMPSLFAAAKPPFASASSRVEEDEAKTCAVR